MTAISIPIFSKETKTRSEKKVEGKVVTLDLGGTKRRFFIHTDLADGAILSDYRSGFRVGKLLEMKISYMHSHKGMTDREAAKRLIEKLLEKYGKEHLLNVMNAETCIN